MSAKRLATSELNYDNWDKEDESPEEKGVFKTASAKELQNRVIKKARRKLPDSSENEGDRKSVFSGFSGFGSTATVSTSSSPFSFLSKGSIPSSTISGDESKKNDISVKKNEESSDNKYKFEKSNNYYLKLKGLNQTVSNWIKSHVDENPVCILSPIFKDYEKYLKEIQSDENGNVATKSDMSENKTDGGPVSSTSQQSSGFSLSSNMTTTTNTSTTGSFSFKPLAPSDQSSQKITSSLFGAASTVAPEESKEKLAGFSGFGTTSSGVFKNNSGFSFGQTKTDSPTTTGFSFSGTKPFSFLSAIKPPDNNNDVEKAPEEEEDQPPKVEFKAVVEEDNVYSKKCKVFVKNDGNFADRGVGTLFLKPVKDSEKMQLLVRADTNLGNILLNLILTEGIPTQKMGKNNVMLVCIPTPEAEQKPTSTLLRVKTAEDADELLETINKYKR